MDRHDRRVELIGNFRLIRDLLQHFWKFFHSTFLSLPKKFLFGSFQVKDAIVDRISNIMIVKTGLINKTDRIGTIGKKDMGDSMTGIDLTSSNRHKQLTDTSIICIILPNMALAIVLSCL